MTFHTGTSPMAKKAKENKTLINTHKKKVGKCENCNYSKYWEILTFHHRNPSEKKFELSSKGSYRKELKEIKEEIKKCSLLCPNCHAELEHLKRIIDYTKLIKQTEVIIC